MADLVFLETFSRQIGLYIVRRLGIHPPEQIGEVRGCLCDRDSTTPVGERRAVTEQGSVTAFHFSVKFGYV